MKGFKAITKKKCWFLKIDDFVSGWKCKLLLYIYILRNLIFESVMYTSEKLVPEDNCRTDSLELSELTQIRALKKNFFIAYQLSAKSFNWKRCHSNSSLCKKKTVM